ncbi:DNA-binding protein WhiA [Brevibacillus laterosporus]|uniref:Probable cell division protein WhiA n=1 Tax=Brevibacillus laterosporus TaxID=1465 RepID=A0AAP3GDC0_BRELA|nr:DNA-binding protein WhiA [Brevibacillus laterosporus]ATO49075.1 DNA-binding protein WhiA [Brevibacillus laterosporus DSM 25]MBG9798659.1 sporulation regulator WhiA [Brevibacillus laterosporus]MBG9803384.1 sporulation regulator WhiA [Brevibacillus laterosporus]MCR8937661.1 DNA-binding protein WhiA [Brevibacillus laterosporus]MCR8982889.1 DNA-binding protein WhiA [Brevibacillus laterosporus]
MSFAAHTKKELTMIEASTCCNRAELAALIRMNGTIQLGTGKFILDISTENAAIARRIYTLVKQIFQIHAELLVRKKMRLKKNNVYIVRIPLRAYEILEDLRIMDKNLTFYPGISPDLVANECCVRAFLRGAFLAGGSVNHPEASSYHLEIFSAYQDFCEALTGLANRYELNAKCIERKKGFVMYIKEGEKITDFLSVIGAHQALLYFEDVRIVKDMRNSVNRLHNCEIANINKTVNAATKQMENIQLIEKEIGLENLPIRLREVAELRLQNPDINLKELGEMIPSGVVSKSGINHRLRKINEIADNLREKLSLST